ncbi:MAG: SecDF P1 head subdomain-containing protein, partial [Bacteroidia bacterium]
NYTLEAEGTPQQASEAYKAVLARLERLDIGGDGFETRLEGNRIYLKLPENKFMQQNPNRLRMYLQHQGQLTLSVVYDNTDIYSKLFTLNDTSESVKAFHQRLFQVMQPQTVQNGDYNFQQGPVIGYVKSTDTALVAALLRDSLPLYAQLFNTKFMFANASNDDFLEVIAVNTNPQKSIHPTLELVELNKDDSYLVINMKFTPDYSTLWAKMTRENINKTIAIIVDGQVYSYPTVVGEITGGQSNISGNFDKETAEVLVNTMRDGYPCQVKIIEESRTNVGK